MQLTVTRVAHVISIGLATAAAIADVYGSTMLATAFSIAIGGVNAIGAYLGGPA